MKEKIQKAQNAQNAIVKRGIKRANNKIKRLNLAVLLCSRQNFGKNEFNMTTLKTYDGSAYLRQYSPRFEPTVLESLRLTRLPVRSKVLVEAENTHRWGKDLQSPV